MTLPPNIILSKNLKNMPFRSLLELLINKVNHSRAKDRALRHAIRELFFRVGSDPLVDILRKVILPATSWPNFAKAQPIYQHYMYEYHERLCQKAYWNLKHSTCSISKILLYSRLNVGHHYLTKMYLVLVLQDFSEPLQCWCPLWLWQIEYFLSCTLPETPIFKIMH